MLPAKELSYLTGAVSLLHCRRVETSLGCSVTVEHEALEGSDDVVCTIRIHGRLGESDTREKRG